MASVRHKLLHRTRRPHQILALVVFALLSYARHLTRVQPFAQQDANGVETTLKCSRHSCMLRNTCVREDGVLLLYGAHAQMILVKNFLATFRVRSFGGARYSAELAGKALPALRYSSRFGILIDRYVENNCGHILGDEVWSVFRLALSHDKGNNIERHGVGDVLLNFSTLHPCDEMFHAISRRVYTLGQRETVCYEKVVLGVSGISYADGYGIESQRYLRSSNFTNEMRMFRKLFYLRSIVKSQATASKVLIMVKKVGSHMVNIENIDELEAVVKVRLPWLSVMRVSWSDMSHHEQVRLLSETKLIISLPGSDLMNGIFLPDGSHIVIFCRYVDGREEASNERALWLKHLGYITVNEFCGDNTRESSNHNVWVNVSSALRVFDEVSLRQLD